MRHAIEPLQMAAVRDHLRDTTALGQEPATPDDTEVDDDEGERCYYTAVRCHCSLVKAPKTQFCCGFGLLCINAILWHLSRWLAICEFKPIFHCIMYGSSPRKRQDLAISAAQMRQSKAVLLHHPLHVNSSLHASLLACWGDRKSCLTSALLCSHRRGEP